MIVDQFIMFITGVVVGGAATWIAMYAVLFKFKKEAVRSLEELGTHAKSAIDDLVKTMLSNLPKK